MTKAQPATALKDMGPTSSTFDVSDRDSMGDMELVSVLVGKMLDDHKALLFEAPNPQAAVGPFIDKWTDTLWAGNDEYIQTLSVESQNAFLRSRGLDSAGEDPKGPVKALIAHTLERNLHAVALFNDGEIDAEMFTFHIATAIEDCVMFLNGLDNPAD